MVPFQLRLLTSYDASDTIQSAHLATWRQALAEMGPERLVRRVYEAEMEGRRGRGRPRRKWNDNFKQ